MTPKKERPEKSIVLFPDLAKVLDIYVGAAQQTAQLNPLHVGVLLLRF